MDNNLFKKITSRLEAIGQIVEKLPPEIRAGAFDLLKSYAHIEASKSGGKGAQFSNSAAQSTENDDREVFFSKFNHDKPADNVKLIAADLYRKFGAEPFTVDEIRKIATDVGITIPDRADMTLVAAVENGKKLFARVARGTFKPTVHGETHLKKTYNIRKGTKIRMKDSE